MIAADEGFEILDRATCLELLATAQVGRLAWATVDGQVHIRPVNYILAGADIIVRTGDGIDPHSGPRQAARHLRSR